MIIGTICINISMPITLFELNKINPNHEGLNFGLLFQMCDDLADFCTKNPTKDAFKDIKEHKITFPIIATLQSSNIEEQKLEAAKGMYQTGNYAGALKLYLDMVNTSYSYKLYYEIGRCYYKLNDLENSELNDADITEITAEVIAGLNEGYKPNN